MFEGSDRGALAGLSDEALITAVSDATRAEAAAAARRLALIGEVIARQCDDEDDEHAHRVIDGWAWAQAAVAAAANLNPYAASKQMRIAQALRDRLSRTAAVFATGVVSAAVIDAICWRTHLVEDPEALALVDAAIAGEADTYGTHSEKALITAVDLWVEKFDPDAVVRSRRAAKDLYVDFDDKDDPNGVASFWGRLRVTDKQILEQRLDALADTVCPEDPRRRRELRAAALAALAAVGPQLERLACQCANPECAGSGKDPSAGAVTIYVLTDQIPATGTATPRHNRPGTAADRPDPAPEHAEQGAQSDRRGSGDARPAEPQTPAAASPGVMLDGAIIPAAMLTDLAAGGAKVQPLAQIAALPTEPRYRPSAALTGFVRMRSITCSFPGCNRAAHRCDLDHLTPWPAGATHPGNLAPLCRLHHLIKTFTGWHPTPAPDGSIRWKAPTGHSYTKTPGAALMFPHWNIHTPIPRTRAVTLLDDGREAKIPTRQRTRTQDRAQRITTERHHNHLTRALEHAENDSDPPPF